MKKQKQDLGYCETEYCMQKKRMATETKMRTNPRGNEGLRLYRFCRSCAAAYDCGHQAGFEDLRAKIMEVMKK